LFIMVSSILNTGSEGKFTEWMSTDYIELEDGNNCLSALGL
jgi:hypothetical protein